MTQIISIKNMISIMNEKTEGYKIKGKTCICSVESNPDIQRGGCFVKIRNKRLFTIDLHWSGKPYFEVRVHNKAATKEILDLDLITEWYRRGSGWRYQKCFDTVEDMFGFAENLVNTILRT